MDTATLVHMLTRLMPAGVHFSVGGEEEPVPPTGTRRIREFAAGRLHARRALREMGIGSASLPREPDGAPGWPAGVVGSISHTDHGGRLVAVAAVASAARWHGLGIDVEAPGPIEARAWPALLTASELARVLDLPVERRAGEVKLLWCAKEAVVKALRPECEIAEIEIVRRPDAVSFSVRLPGTGMPGTSVGLESSCCAGQAASGEGWACAVAAVPASSRWFDGRSAPTP